MRSSIRSWDDLLEFNEYKTKEKADIKKVKANEEKFYFAEEVEFLLDRGSPKEDVIIVGDSRLISGKQLKASGTCIKRKGVLLLKIGKGKGYANKILAALEVLDVDNAVIVTTFLSIEEQNAKKLKALEKYLKKELKKIANEASDFADENGFDLKTGKIRKFLRTEFELDHTTKKSAIKDFADGIQVKVEKEYKKQFAKFLNKKYATLNKEVKKAIITPVLSAITKNEDVDFEELQENLGEALTLQRNKTVRQWGGHLGLPRDDERYPIDIKDSFGGRKFHYRFFRNSFVSPGVISEDSNATEMMNRFFGSVSWRRQFHLSWGSEEENPHMYFSERTNNEGFYEGNWNDLRAEFKRILDEYKEKWKAAFQKAIDCDGDF